MFSNEKVAKSSNNKFFCEVCDYSTSKKYNYEKHLSTSKHIESMSSNNSVVNVVKVATIYILVFIAKKYTKTILDYGDTKKNVI
jgi:hypothetical protein